MTGYNDIICTELNLGGSTYVTPGRTCLSPFVRAFKLPVALDPLQHCIRCSNELYNFASYDEAGCQGNQVAEATSIRTVCDEPEAVSYTPTWANICEFCPPRLRTSEKRKKFKKLEL